MHKSSLGSLVSLLASVSAVALVAPACGSSSGETTTGNRDGGGGGGGDDDTTGDSGPLGPLGPIGDSGNPTGPCSGLGCQIHACTGGGSTTISGTIYDPAAKNPLYNVVVYVPNATPGPLTTGASCESCNSLYSGDPIATAVTGADGKFTIKNAPDGKDIPLVIQVGKWRMQTKIANVASCQDNLQPDKTLRLPKNHVEGDVPSIAISTGGADTLECLLRRVGLDASEYGGGASSAGHIHIFKGADNAQTNAPNTNPAGPPSFSSLWASKASLMPFDIVLLSCEGQETTDTAGNGANGTALSPADMQAVHDYASAGGRVFASHYHYAFFNAGPYAAENLASWVPDSSISSSMNGTIVQTLPNGQKFDKGVALHDWLKTVGALTSDELHIEEARHDADVTATNTPSQSWIQSDSSSKAKCKTGSTCATMYFSFNTPTDAKTDDAGVPAYCGRVVYSDLHVGAASSDYSADATRTVPTGCTDKDLSAQEKALEFMLFDLSSCVTPDNQPPPPPPPPVK